MADRRALLIPSGVMPGTYGDASNIPIIVVDAQGRITGITTVGVSSGSAALVDFKDSCRVATTANITLSGTQTIDGVSVIAGERVLVKDQTTGSQNGIYVCASGSWARATDFDTNAEVTAGCAIPIAEGTTNADKLFLLTTNDPITVGTTALIFAALSGGGSVAGSNTHIQYNSGGTFAGSGNFTWDESTKTLTLANAGGTGFIDLKGVSNSGALRLQGATHPGGGGGLILPFVAGGISSGPGLFWANGSYGGTAGFWIAGGLNLQGWNSSNSAVKIRKGTGTSSDGTATWVIDPDNHVLNQTSDVSNTNSIHDGQTYDISSTGTAAAGFGYGILTKLENGSGSQVNAFRQACSWTVVTAGSETSKVAIQTQTAGAGLAEAFAIQGAQNYGVYYDQGNTSGNVTIDFNRGNFIRLRLTGNITSTTFSNLKAGARYTIKIEQDGTGSRTWTPPTLFKLQGGISGNVLTPNANAVDLFICDCDGTNLWAQQLFDVKNP